MSFDATCQLTSLKNVLQPVASNVSVSPPESVKRSKTWGELDFDVPVVDTELSVDPANADPYSPFAGLAEVEVSTHASKPLPCRKASFTRFTTPPEHGLVEPASPVTPDSFMEVQNRPFRRSSSSLSLDSDSCVEELACSPRRSFSQGLSDISPRQSLRKISFSEKQRHPAIIVRKLRSFSENRPCSFDTTFPAVPTPRRTSSSGASALSNSDPRSPVGLSLTQRSVSERFIDLDSDK